MGRIIIQLMRLAIYLIVFIWAGASLYYHNTVFLWFFLGVCATMFVLAVERLD